MLESESLHFAGVHVTARKLFDRRGNTLLKDEIYRVDNPWLGARHINYDDSNFLKALIGRKSI